MKQDAINYAIRNNDLEGLITSQETAIMLKRVTTGELTFTELLKAIDYKARKLAQGKKMNLIESWEICKPLK